MIKLIVFCILLYGILRLLNFKLDTKLFGEDIKNLTQALFNKHKGADNKSLKTFIIETEGRKKENPFSKANIEAKTALENIGQKNRFKKTQLFAFCASALGFASGIAFGNILLSLVLAVGLYFIPLWLTRFAVYKYTRSINEELSVALGMITTSYIRTSDFQSAVQENAEFTTGAVYSAFNNFLNSLKINPSMIFALDNLKNDIDNALFKQWVDTIILCQEDHALRFALTPTVQKFSSLKMMQMENETKMTMPLKQSVIIVGIAFLFIPFMNLISAEWYSALVNTAFGQISIAFTAIASLLIINKSIKLSGPIEFSI